MPPCRARLSVSALARIFNFTMARQLPWLGRALILQHSHGLQSLAGGSAHARPALLRSFATAAASKPEEREQLQFDVCIVGAGPAGLAAAIRVKQVCVPSHRLFSPSQHLVAADHITQTPQVQLGSCGAVQQNAMRECVSVCVRVSQLCKEMDRDLSVCVLEKASAIGKAHTHTNTHIHEHTRAHTQCAVSATRCASLHVKNIRMHGFVCVCARLCVLCVGAHTISGCVLEPRALDELLPEWKNDPTCPIQVHTHTGAHTHRCTHTQVHTHTHTHTHARTERERQRELLKGAHTYVHAHTYTCKKPHMKSSYPGKSVVSCRIDTCLCACVCVCHTGPSGS